MIIQSLFYFEKYQNRWGRRSCVFLSVSRHVSSSKDRGSLVIIEAIMLVPIIVGIVGFASAYLPLPERVRGT